MILSDGDINYLRQLGWLDIEPWNPDQVQPASYDLTLGSLYSCPDTDEWNVPFASLTVLPGEFYLLHTQEVITVSANVVGFVAGKSSRAREGWICENAGLVDPGFSGQIVLEVANLRQSHLTLTSGMKMAQIYFSTLRSKCQREYGDKSRNSHYQGQLGAVGSRAS